MAGARRDQFLITVVLGVLVVACSPAASSAPSAASSQLPSAAPSQPASAGPSGAGIVLARTGPIGCDAIGVDYTSATIKIDAASDPDVWAETDAGKKLTIAWTDGFTATDATPACHQRPEGRGGRPRRDDVSACRRMPIRGWRATSSVLGRTRSTSWRPIRSSAQATRRPEPGPSSDPRPMAR